MIAERCACCNVGDGETIGNGYAKLHQIEIISKYQRPTGTATDITLCNICKEALPFDIDALMHHVNRQIDRQSSSDAIIEDFISRYIRDIWPEETPPSGQHLCDVMNSIGLRSIKGNRWTYHNLMQKLNGLGIDREALIAQRQSAAYADRIQKLARLAAEFLYRTQYVVKDTPKPPMMHIDSGDIPIVGMPLDMPGVVRPGI